MSSNPPPSRCSLAWFGDYWTSFLATAHDRLGRTRGCVAALAFAHGSLTLMAAEIWVDNWDDALRTITTLREGHPHFDREEMRSLQNYRNPHVALSFSQKKMGAFSIIRAAKNSDSADGFAFKLPMEPDASLMTGVVEVTGWLHGAPAGRVDVAFLYADGSDLARSDAELRPAGADGWQQWSAKLTLPSPAKHGTMLT
jgi:hypothetical protein